MNHPRIFSDCSSVWTKTLPSGAFILSSYGGLANFMCHAYTYKSASSTDTARLNAYTYDKVNRLVSADIAGTSYGYSYDNTGNLTQRKKGATTDTFRYNIGDQLATYDINGATFYASYDLDGNMLSDGVYTYQYSAAGKISKITTSQDTITYENNYDGLRHGKTVGANTKIVFNYNKDNQLISERKSTTATPDTFYSWANDRVVSLTKYSSTGGTYDSYYLHADSTGNIINITNKNGAVVKTYEYDPYGNVIATTGTLDQPFQYKGAFGYYTDKETGLIYLQQRYYSLKLMRFMSADQSHNSIDRLSQKLKTPLELNPYIYSQDNPVNVMDEDGNHGKYFRNLGFTIPLLNVKSAFIYWENHGGCTWWDFHHSTDGAFGMRGDFRWHCHSWAAGVIFTAGGVIYNGYTWFYKGGVDQVPGHPESHFSKMYAVKQQYDAMWP